MNKLDKLHERHLERARNKAKGHQRLLAAHRQALENVLRPLMGTPPEAVVDRFLNEIDQLDADGCPGPGGPKKQND